MCFAYSTTPMKRTHSSADLGRTKTRTVKKKKGDYQAGRELPKAPKSELKAYDLAHTVLAITNVAGPPNFFCMNAMVNGAELYQRVGRKVYNKSLHIRGRFEPSGGSTDDYARLLVIYDSQPNGAFPTIQTLLQDSNAAAATTVDSGINLANRQRFKVLRDYPVLLGVAGAAANTTIIPDPILHSYNVDMFIKLKGLESVYNATNGGTVADIMSGVIFIVALSGGNQPWDFYFTSCLRYYD